MPIMTRAMSKKMLQLPQQEDPPAKPKGNRRGGGDAAIVTSKSNDKTTPDVGSGKQSAIPVVKLIRTKVPAPARLKQNDNNHHHNSTITINSFNSSRNNSINSSMNSIGSIGGTPKKTKASAAPRFPNNKALLRTATTSSSTSSLIGIGLGTPKNNFRLPVGNSSRETNASKASSTPGKGSGAGSSGIAFGRRAPTTTATSICSAAWMNNLPKKNKTKKQQQQKQIEIPIIDLCNDTLDNNKTQLYVGSSSPSSSSSKFLSNIPKIRSTSKDSGYSADHNNDDNIKSKSSSSRSSNSMTKDLSILFSQIQITNSNCFFGKALEVTQIGLAEINRVGEELHKRIVETRDQFTSPLASASTTTRSFDAETTVYFDAKDCLDSSNETGMDSNNSPAPINVVNELQEQEEEGHPDTDLDQLVYNNTSAIESPQNCPVVVLNHHEDKNDDGSRLDLDLEVKVAFNHVDVEVEGEEVENECNVGILEPHYDDNDYENDNDNESDNASSYHDHDQYNITTYEEYQDEETYEERQLQKKLEIPKWAADSYDLHKILAQQNPNLMTIPSSMIAAYYDGHGNNTPTTTPIGPPGANNSSSSKNSKKGFSKHSSSTTTIATASTLLTYDYLIFPKVDSTTPKLFIGVEEDGKGTPKPPPIAPIGSHARLLTDLLEMELERNLEEEEDEEEEIFELDI